MSLDIVKRHRALPRQSEMRVRASKKHNHIRRGPIFMKVRMFSKQATCTICEYWTREHRPRPRVRRPERGKRTYRSVGNTMLHEYGITVRGTVVPDDAARKDASLRCRSSGNPHMEGKQAQKRLAASASRAPTTEAMGLVKQYRAGFCAAESN